MARKARKIAQVAHTFDVHHTHADVVKAYTTMATKIRDDEKFAKDLFEACDPQDPSDPVNVRELDFFLDCNVWPEHYILKDFVRTYADVKQLRDAATQYLSQGGGPG